MTKVKTRETSSIETRIWEVPKTGGVDGKLMLRWQERSKNQAASSTIPGCKICILVFELNKILSS